MSGMSAAYIAVDLGAESGRVIVGALAEGRLRLEEVRRFAHEPANVRDIASKSRRIFVTRPARPLQTTGVAD
jgi:hypothetical protein